jgi:hypothetical protein
MNYFVTHCDKNFLKYAERLFETLSLFSINKIIPIVLGPLDFSITNSSLLVFVSCGVAFLFYNFACANAKLIPSA